MYVQFTSCVYRLVWVTLRALSVFIPLIHHHQHQHLKIEKVYLSLTLLRVKIFRFFLKITLNGSSHQRCPMKKGVLRNFTKFTGKHLCQRCNSGIQRYSKETLAQLFSCEFCEISKNIFFKEHLR